LPNHEILEEIGKGKNARVFSAYNKVQHRQEALKVWCPRKDDTRVDENRFYSELRKNSQFTGNDSIATIYTGDCWKDIYYCLMEYCPGVTLKEFLKHDPSWVYRWGFARQISDTLRSIYEKGIYHGDLHDRNIMIDIENEHNSLKILDLGTSILSGQKMSHERDARLLFKLSLQLFPPLGRLAFYNNKEIQNLSSPLINKAFRAVINISNPTIPPDQKHFDCPPSLYLPPDYRKLGIWHLVSMVVTTPVFSLGLIEKFLTDFEYGTDGRIAFYQELCKRIVGDASVNTAEMINIVTEKYEQLSMEYLRKAII